MARTSRSNPLGLAGLHEEDERLYRAVLRGSGLDRAQLAEVTGLSRAALDAAIHRFAERGLVRDTDGLVTAIPPDRALGTVLREETERARAAAARVDDLRNLLPSLVSEYLASKQRGGSSAEVHAVQGVHVPSLLKALAADHPGDLLWMRPDQWRLSASAEMDAWVREAIDAGRTSRALYPAHVLEVAPDTIRTRAAGGEHVRILASVPSRLAVLGGTVALLPERWGENSPRLLVVREHSIVGAVTALFEGLWERAMAVPGFGGLDEVQGADGSRQLLLHQLAQGAKDEQIARALGLSLRTVRRRVAEVMAELGAGSRFQAGVEAVRRGWI